MKQTTTNTFERKLISFDKSDYNKALRFAETDLAAYNKFLKAIVTNVPEQTINLTTVEAIWNNPQEYAFDSLVGDTPLKIAGVTVNKKKAMDLIDIPKSWANVIKVTLQVKGEFQSKTVHGDHNDVIVDRLTFSAMEIVNNSFKLTDDYLNELKDEYSQYTKNEKQNKALDLLTSIHSNLLELSSMGILFGSQLTILDQLGFTMGETLRLEPNSIITSLK